MLRNPLFLASSVYFLFNVSIQCSQIFLPLFGSQLGASDFQVGLLGAAYGIAFLLSSLYSGQQSDRRGKLIFVRFGLFLCTISFAGQLLVGQVITLALVRAFIGISLGITTAALVAYAFESGADMGKFSSFSSLGWIAGAITASLLEEFNFLFGVSILCCTAAFMLSLLFKTNKTSIIPTKKTSTPFLGAVLKQSFSIYLAVFFRHLGATSVFIILPLYFTSLGLDRFWIGLLWGTNFIVQFLVMRRLDGFNPRRVFAFGQVVSILVFLGYALIHYRYPMLIIQVMLGIAWACLYVGGLLLVLRTGEERGTASGIFQATLNLSNAVGPLLGGLIAQIWGYQGVMYFAAVLGVAGLLIAIPDAKNPAQQNQVSN